MHYEKIRVTEISDKDYPHYLACHKHTPPPNYFQFIVKKCPRCSGLPYRSVYNQYQEQRQEERQEHSEYDLLIPSQKAIVCKDERERRSSEM